MEEDRARRRATAMLSRPPTTSYHSTFKLILSYLVLKMYFICPPKGTVSPLLLTVVCRANRLPHTCRQVPVYPATPTPIPIAPAAGDAIKASPLSSKLIFDNSTISERARESLCRNIHEHHYKSAMSFNYIKNAGKFLCIGRNYMAHIKELNNQKPTEPFFFLKPRSSALIPGQGPIQIPENVIAHHEVELACIIGKKLQNLDPDKFGPDEALDAIDGYALAIDMTARNVQDAAKKKGLPWTIGKGFDTFMPLSPFITKAQIVDPYAVELNLKVNDEHRQSDLTDLMIFPIHKFISKMSSIMTLYPGDVILTGTPKGVGPVRPLDKVEAWCTHKGELVDGSHMKFDVIRKPGPYVFKEE